MILPPGRRTGQCPPMDSLAPSLQIDNFTDDEGEGRVPAFLRRAPPAVAPAPPLTATSAVDHALEQSRHVAVLGAIEDSGSEVRDRNCLPADHNPLSTSEKRYTDVSL